VITGTATDSRIIVDAGDDGNVHLILAGMSISNGTTAPHICQNSEKLPHNTADGTENTVTDSRSEETDTASSGTDTETNTDTNTASDTEADTDDSQEDLLRGDLQQERSDHQRQRYADGEGRIQRRDQIKG
jgi:hypothetical protein